MGAEGGPKVVPKFFSGTCFFVCTCLHLYTWAKLPPPAHIKHHFSKNLERSRALGESRLSVKNLEQCMPRAQLDAGGPIVVVGKSWCCRVARDATVEGGEGIHSHTRDTRHAPIRWPMI